MDIRNKTFHWICKNCGNGWMSRGHSDGPKVEKCPICEPEHEDFKNSWIITRS